MELSDDATLAVLERWPVAALSTTGDRGPHAVPVVFARAAGALWSPIDGKPKRGGELARIRHIRRDPRVSLLFSHYEEDWTRLWWLRADGEAEIWSAPEPGRGAEETAALAALRRKYPQYARVALLGPDALLLRIAVTARRSWCASEAGGAALLAYLSSGAVRDV
jgi:PPOX class probable F420-dependent enzyme